MWDAPETRSFVSGYYLDFALLPWIPGFVSLIFKYFEIWAKILENFKSAFCCTWCGLKAHMRGLRVPKDGQGCVLGRSWALLGVPWAKLGPAGPRGCATLAILLL